MQEKKVTVKCGACGEISDLKGWKDVQIESIPFEGGCPTCAGEFYDIVSSKGVNDHELCL